MISKLAIFVVEINSIVSFISDEQSISPVQERYPLRKWHLTIAPSFWPKFKLEISMLIENWPNKLMVNYFPEKSTFDAMIMMIWNIYIILTVRGQISWRFKLIRFQTTFNALIVFFATKVATMRSLYKYLSNAWNLSWVGLWPNPPKARTFPEVPKIVTLCFSWSVNI